MNNLNKMSDEERMLLTISFFLIIFERDFNKNSSIN